MFSSAMSTLVGLNGLRQAHLGPSRHVSSI